MIPTQDLQRWQQAITGITALQGELSPEELAAFQTLSSFMNSSNFEATESGGNIQILKKCATKNRLLKAHLTNFIAMSDKYFKAQTIPQQDVTPPPVVAPVPTIQQSAEVTTPPPSQPKAPVVPSNVAPADVPQWQKSLQGIADAQKDLAQDEFSAFRALTELYNNGNFEENKSGTYIQLLKKSTTKNRLLKVHLTNFVTLCEKYFKAQAVEVPTPTPVINTPQVTPPIFEPPTFEPPTFEPPVETPPAPNPKADIPIETPPQEVAPEPTVDIPVTHESQPYPHIIPDPSLPNNNEDKKTKCKKRNQILIIILAALCIIGYIVVKNYDNITHFVNCKILKDCPIDSLTLNISVLFFDEEGATEQLIATFYPENVKNKIVIWQSSNDTIATVDSVGLVTAVTSGSAIITASVGNVSAICNVTVEIAIIENDTIPGDTILPPDPNSILQPPVTTVPEKATEKKVEQKIEKPVKEPTKQQITTKTYPFGKYEGNTLNGYPEGQGTMYYTKRVQIAKHGENTYYAEAGDTYVGLWGNGDIVNGKLKDKDNNLKATILAGKRPKVYDISND